MRVETILLGCANLRDGFLVMRLKNRERMVIPCVGTPYRVYIGLVGVVRGG